MAGGILAEGEQVIRLKVSSEVLFRLFADALHPAAGTLRNVPAAHQQIENTSKYRKGEDQHEPRDFVSWLNAAAYNEQGGHHTEEDTKPVETGRVFREEIDHDSQSDHLSHKGQPNKHRAME